MKYFLLLLFSIANTACEERNCAIENIQLIQDIQMGNNSVISYHHEVLIKGFSFGCFDSTTVLNALAKYRDTAETDYPIESISIFRSKNGYDLGETLSQPKEYNRNKVLTIYFNLKSNQPEEYTLYKRGKKVYEGERWPNVD